ncbi:MAG: ribosome recycling factor [Flavobacteriales bacterium]|nr:MAG: ribosome recycling factor [Flavobacteriales bacterium]
MNEEVNMILDLAREAMDSAITHLENELIKIRAGKANPNMLDSVTVDYYGSNMPLNQIANVKTLDARTLVVQPWEKPMLDEIQKAIQTSNLGIAPQNNGEMIIISIPHLTEERRISLVRQGKSEGENAKVSIRNARRDANEEIKKLEKDNLSEDNAKDAEDEVQKFTNEYGEKVDKLVGAKEKDIMTL